MQKLSPQRQCLHRTSLHTTFIEPLNIYADIIPTSQNFTQKSLKVDEDFLPTPFHHKP